MSRNTKIFMAILGALVVVCLCAGGVAFFFFRSAGQAIKQAVATEPEQVANIAQRMVDYSLPAGYVERFGMSFLGFDMVAFGPADGGQQMIMLMQFPPSAGLDRQAMEQQMQQSLEQQTGRRNLQLQVVDQTTTTVRDQTITLTIQEGTDADGAAIRQMSGVFQGKVGPTLLMIQGSPQNWDQAAVDAFINSLR